VDLDLNDEQELFRKTAGKFLADRWPTSAVRGLIANPGGLDRNIWERGAELGWTSLLVPEDLGGGSLSGDGVRDLAIIAEEAGRALVAGPLLPTNIVAFALARDAAGQLAKTHLPEIAAGRQLAAWSGPATGVLADPARDGYRLTGTVSPVQDAQVADYLLLTVHDGTRLLVPVHTTGVRVEVLDGLDLSRRYCQVRFDEARVPASVVVGASTEDGAAAADLALALALQCAETVGATRAAYEMTLRYVRERKAFGRPIGSYQTLKHRLAEMLLWLESAQAVTSAAVAGLRADGSGTAGLTSARMAKAYVADRCPAIVRDCLQMHGGVGYTWEHDIHLFLRRVETNAEIYGGAAHQLGALAATIGF
jgi:alkylation response protein AidB-like acyl-CoA dehydrogenase